VGASAHTSPRFDRTPPGDARFPRRVKGRSLRVSIGDIVAKKRILFIDNRPEHLAQPVLRLQVAGYEVEAVDSGSAGLEALREDGYELLILDAELPSEDGWDVLKTVRSDPKLRNMKVIVFMAPQGETGKLVLVPVDAELRRPFNLGTLLRAVERVIGPA
jgi:DNA-binding response OmpR family regulator